MFSAMKGFEVPLAVVWPSQGINVFHPLTPVILHTFKNQSIIDYRKYT